MDRLFVLEEVFRQVFDNDDLRVTPETGPRDIPGWDSVAHMKLILTIEEDFAVQFTDEEVASLQTVGELLAAIAAHKEHQA